MSLKSTNLRWFWKGECGRKKSFLENTWLWPGKAIYCINHFQGISIRETNSTILWIIKIYLMDTVIHLLNDWGQMVSSLQLLLQKTFEHYFICLLELVLLVSNPSLIFSCFNSSPKFCGYFLHISQPVWGWKSLIYAEKSKNNMLCIPYLFSYKQSDFYTN